MSETKNEINYYFAVIVLLVIMMAAVAGLWVIEHKKLNNAMAFISAQQKTQQSQDGKIRDMLLDAQIEKIHMLDRDKFVKKTAVINGKQADVFIVSRIDAVKTGLMEGDIIFVDALPGDKPDRQTGQSDSTKQ